MVVLVLVLLIAWTGDAFAPTLLVHAPLVLVALSPRARNLLLASRSVSSVALAAVAVARRLVLVPVLYRLGALRGDDVLAWVDRRFPRWGRMTRTIEGWFGRRPTPAVVALPGGLTALLAGATAMPLAAVLALSAAGFTIRVTFVLWLGEVFGSPLDSFLGFVRDYQWPLTGLSCALVLIHVARHRRRLRRTATVQ